MPEATNGRPQANGKVSYAEKYNIADHFIGGNRLENAPASKVKDFVAQNGGHTVITNVSFAAIVSALAMGWAGALSTNDPYA